MSIHIFAMMKLEDAIKQNHFPNPHLRAAINIYYTSARLQAFENDVLKPFGISLQQFNLLRILRGQKGNPISISEIADRMIDKMSNASRLAEKLRIKSFIERRICPMDRRRVEVVLTDRGRTVIEEASLAMDQAVTERLEKLSNQEILKLNDLLDKVNV